MIYSDNNLLYCKKLYATFWLQYSRNWGDWGEKVAGISKL